MIEIKNVLKIINNNSLKKFSKYNKLYLFTTENLNYLSNFQSKKKALSVCASGDHIINLILFGSIDITAFDINILSKYILYLKLEIIKTFNYETYLDFFIFNPFNYEIFKQINLDKETYLFWNGLYEIFEFDGIKIYNSNLFIKNDKDFYIRNNPYLIKENYNKVKQCILNTKINFINCNILSLINYKSYNLILLSNISDYINNIFSDNSLVNFNDFINKLKNNNEMIIMAYLYDFRIKENYRSCIDNIENIDTYFDNINIYKFISAYNTTQKDAIIVKE